MIRKTIYKMELHCENGKILPITIATNDIQRIEPLVERNRALYSARGFNIQRFVIADTKYLLNVPEHEYDQELIYCDIVDDNDVNSGPSTSPTISRRPSTDLAEEFEVDENFRLVPRRR